MNKKNNENAKTVAQWVEEYLRDYVYPTCKPSAAEHYADNLLKHLVPALGKLPLRDLDAATLQRFFNTQALHGNLRTGGALSTKSVRNLRVAVSACLTQAVALGLIGSNPVPGTVIRRTPRVIVDTLGEADRSRLLTFLCKDDNAMNPALIVAAELGLRRGELCALRWRDYDPAGYLHVNSTVKRLRASDPDCKSKTCLVINEVKTDSSRRELVLSPFLHKLVALQAEKYRVEFGEPGEDDFIFFNTAGGITDPDNLSHYFSDVLAGLGLPHVKLHALRHTFASRAVELGVDIETISGILGHSDVTTTAHYYLHPRQQAMNDALWKLSSAPGLPPVRGVSPATVSTPGHTFRRRSGFSKAAVIQA